MVTGIDSLFENSHFLLATGAFADSFRFVREWNQQLFLWQGEMVEHIWPSNHPFVLAGDHSGLLGALEFTRYTWSEVTYYNPEKWPKTWVSDMNENPSNVFFYKQLENLKEAKF